MERADAAGSAMHADSLEVDALHQEGLIFDKCCLCVCSLLQALIPRAPARVKHPVQQCISDRQAPGSRMFQII